MCVVSPTNSSLPPSSSIFNPFSHLVAPLLSSQAKRQTLKPRMANEWPRLGRREYTSTSIPFHIPPSPPLKPQSYNHKSNLFIPHGPYNTRETLGLISLKAPFPIGRPSISPHTNCWNQRYYYYVPRKFSVKIRVILNPAGWLHVDIFRFFLYSFEVYSCIGFL